MSLWAFLLNIAESEVFWKEDYTEKEEIIIDNSNLGINYQKHRKAHNPINRWTEANTTRQFINNLHPKLEYKLLRALERSKPELYALLSWLSMSSNNQILLDRKQEIYEIMKNTIGVPIEHIVACENSITIPLKPWCLKSNPAQEILWMLWLSQISYHKSKIRLEPQKYDNRWLIKLIDEARLDGKEYLIYEWDFRSDDITILKRLGVNHIDMRSGYKLELNRNANWNKWKDYFKSDFWYTYY